MRNGVFGCLVLALVFSTGCGSKSKAQREAEDLMRESAEKSAAERDRQNKVVAEGDALWAGGEKKYDAAFEKYMVVVNASVPLMGKDALPKDVLARVYGRVIDVALDRRDNTALAQEVAVKALRKDIIPLTASKKSGPVLDAARKVVKAQDKERDERMAKNGFEWKPPTDVWTPPGDQPPGDGKQSPKMEKQFKALVFQVKPRMTTAQVKALLGEPDESQRDDLGKFNPEKKGQILEILTWRDEANPKNSSIVLGFVNGTLRDGGTTGYDVNKGFINKGK